MATSNGNVDVVNALLGIKGIDVNAKDGNGYTPLHFAAKVGYTEVVNALLGTKEIKVNVQDVVRGDTPLHLAAERSYEGIVKALLAKEASVDIKNHNGMTPLDLTTNKEIKALLQIQNTNNEDGSREQNDEGEEDSTVEPHKIKIGAADHGKLIEPQQTEEQTNTFLDSFFSMLIQPVSLVVLFFGGLISWLFLSNTGKTEGHIEQFHNPLVGPNDSDYNDQNDLHLF